ncbi:uncharacterized protein HMPREF1541_00715 [Cyphellophora europaea CBS 101466]|uniref:BTB domain-containing protein n=1 Tax=Cyphellophora europaea (strain CBS 101466) TaxID=1220924 RepID=W2SD32_CYPE1|nr:uncharacterized protein HMPREF1541_00715 [Cyphellophora europaea CBS 101466]ETN46530.1 hypothetical protein HMPREF1541_00715 [Cyphellophora europaea CBS 101466]
MADQTNNDTTDDNAIENEQAAVVPVRGAHNYAIQIIDDPRTCSFAVHKDMIRPHSPMMAAWIGRRAKMTAFAVSSTTPPAVAMMIAYMYSSKTPTLNDLRYSWPDLLPDATIDQRTLPKTSRPDFFEFKTQVQAYDLAVRYIIPGLKPLLAEAAYRYTQQALLNDHELGNAAISEIMSHTHPDDDGLRGRVVSLCLVLKPVLDSTAEGQGALAIIEANVPWTWKTALRAIEMVKTLEEKTAGRSLATRESWA